MNVSIN